MPNHRFYGHPFIVPTAQRVSARPAWACRTSRSGAATRMPATSSKPPYVTSVKSLFAASGTSPAPSRSPESGRSHGRSLPSPPRCPGRGIWSVPSWPPGRPTSRARSSNCSSANWSPTRCATRGDRSGSPSVSGTGRCTVRSRTRTPPCPTCATPLGRRRRTRAVPARPSCPSAGAVSVRPRERSSGSSCPYTRPLTPRGDRGGPPRRPRERRTGPLRSSPASRTPRNPTPMNDPPRRNGYPRQESTSPARTNAHQESRTMPQIQIRKRPRRPVKVSLDLRTPSGKRLPY